MKLCHTLLLLVIFITSNVLALDHSKDINTRFLTKNDNEWVLKKFTSSFMSVYKDKVFVVTVGGNPQIWGPKEFKEKETWLAEVTHEECNDYVMNEKNGYKAVGILYRGELVGALFYRLMGDATIYLAQYFILPRYQKHGIGSYVLDTILPKLYPRYKRYEALTRHQNDAAMLLYKKLGFSVGDI